MADHSSYQSYLAGVGSGDSRLERESVRWHQHSAVPLSPAVLSTICPSFSLLLTRLRILIPGLNRYPSVLSSIKRGYEGWPWVR